LILLASTFIFNLAYTALYLYRARVFAKQLQKERDENKNLEYSVYPTLELFKGANEKTLEILHSSQSGDGNPTEIITIILDK